MSVNISASPAVDHENNPVKDAAFGASLDAAATRLFGAAPDRDALNFHSGIEFDEPVDENGDLIEETDEDVATD